MLTGSTSDVRTLAVIVLLLAVFGASTPCVAACITQQTVPPCHQHAKGKNSGSEPCKHLQPVADAQAIFPPVVQTPVPAEATLALFSPETAPSDSVGSPFSVLRL